MREAIRRPTGLLAAASLLLLAGCASPGPPAPALPAPDAVVVEPPPAVASVAEPIATPPPAVRTPRPRAEIVLVLDDSTAINVAVAAEIENSLPPRQFRVARFAPGDTDALATLRDRDVTVVAVGTAAVRAARAALPEKPLVFCQTPAYDEALRSGSAAWGVEALPPLELQLKSWRSVDPTLRTVALIVSASSAGLAEQARHAAARLATDLLIETSASDRETLYLFRRLSSDVDGLWLLPDTVALSPQVLRELLSHAAARGIGVLTFSEALLPRGALLTATAVPSDVAATVARLVELAVTGATAGLPKVTALSAAALAVNPAVAAALGLPPPIDERWVARDPD